MNLKRLSTCALISGAMLSTTGCLFHHKAKNVNPIANVDSKQPDKVLFDRAMTALAQRKFDVARLTLQTLINTYPDSEYIARAKLGVADSWYREGGTTALQQAEIEYKDFITFFPNMADAAEAQMKVADIHYRQMGKADRDFTQAMRAEDEYRQMIQQFPDSKLVPEAMQRLREVQEVLAQREFEIGRFYYMKQSFSAAAARLKSLVDTYPLYSGADEALFMLGQTYEEQMKYVDSSKGDEKTKQRLDADLRKDAQEAYDRILTRYPASDRSNDARKRLEAMELPVPTPTPEAIAQNKAEIASRGETGRFGKIMGNFKHGPDVAQADSIGQPPLTDPKQTSATDVVRELVRAGVGQQKTSVQIIKGGLKPNAAPPRSDTTVPAANGEAAPATDQTAAPDANAPAAAQPAAPPADNQSPAQTGIDQLTPTPNSAETPATNTAAPGATTNAQPAQSAITGQTPASPLPPPPQVNDASSSSSQATAAAAPAAGASNAAPLDKKKDSTSKKKKKKKLKIF